MTLTSERKSDIAIAITLSGLGLAGTVGGIMLVYLGLEAGELVPQLFFRPMFAATPRVAVLHILFGEFCLAMGVWGFWAAYKCLREEWSKK